MDQLTVSSLYRSGFTLYGFMAVQCSDKAGVPLVWCSSHMYGIHTLVNWVDAYAGYTSSSQIAPDAVVEASFSVDMLLGQLLEVGEGGVGALREGFVPTALGFLNTTASPFTCGVMQQSTVDYAAACAFPLHGGNLQLITPLDEVVLMFSTTPFSVGQVVDTTYGPSIWINMSGAAERSVAYDINQGWSWGGYSWAKAIAPATPLGPLLIQPSAYLAQIAEYLRALL